MSIERPEKFSEPSVSRGEKSLGSGRQASVKAQSDTAQQGKPDLTFTGTLLASSGPAVGSAGQFRPYSLLGTIEAAEKRA